MAFVAGLISFLSPCVLPLIPGYISFISGVSLQEMKGGSPGNGLLTRQKLNVVLNSVFFIVGFSLIFILLGASATWLGTLLSTRISFLTKMAGLVIIFFGVFKMGLIRPLFFFKEARFNVENQKLGFIWAMIIGASFAFGPLYWSSFGWYSRLRWYSGTCQSGNSSVVCIFSRPGDSFSINSIWCESILKIF